MRIRLLASSQWIKQSEGVLSERRFFFRSFKKVADEVCAYSRAELWSELAPRDDGLDGIDRDRNVDRLGQVA